MRTLKFGIAFIIAAAIAVLCVANSSDVLVRLWPDVSDYGLPVSPGVEAPLFIVGLLSGLVGFLLGAAREWLREGQVRSAARRATKEAQTLKAKVNELTRDDDDDIPAIAGR